MGTITWRNVDKLSSDDMGKSFLDSAQQSINGSFKGLGGILKTYQDTADANQVVAKENATYDFMQRIMAAKTAGEFDANSPELMGALATQGAGMDRSKILPFMDKRGAELQARDTATTVFNNAQAVEQQRPAVEAYRVLAQKGDKIGMAAFEAANPGIRNMSALLGEARGIEDGIAKTALDARNTEQVIAASKLRGTNDTITAGATAMNASTNVKQLKLQEDEARVKGFERATAQAALYEGKAREVSAGTINSPEGRKIIDAQIEAMLGKRDPDDKLRETLRANVNAALADPANRGMPVTDFLAAVGSAKPGRTWAGNLFNNEGTYGENIKDDLKGVRSQKGYLDSLEKREKLTDSNMVKADQFKTMMNGYYPDLAEAANPTGGVPTSAAMAPAVPAAAVVADPKREAVKAILNTPGEYTPPADSPAGIAVQRRIEEVAARQALVGKAPAKDIGSDVSAALEISDPSQRRKKLTMLQASAGFADLPITVQTDVFKTLNGVGTKKQK